MTTGCTVPPAASAPTKWDAACAPLPTNESAERFCRKNRALVGTTPIGVPLVPLWAAAAGSVEAGCKRCDMGVPSDRSPNIWADAVLASANSHPVASTATLYWMFIGGGSNLNR